LVTAFFSVGVGAGAGINYLVEEREPVAKVLRGDIDQTIQLIDSLDFKQRYCSGVHRFTESGLPEKTKTEIMDSFENTIFSGMEQEQRPPVLWVQHQEKGGTELHFIIPEVEMTTGKKFTPYFHKTDLDLVDSWKNVVNHDYELSDPNSSERRQSLTVSKNLPRIKKEAVQKIDHEITNMVKNGNIKNRDDVMKTLEGAGFQVTKITKKFISIQAEDWKAPARLKGDWYGEQFTSLDGLRNEIKESGERYKAETEQRYQGDRERLQGAIERRTRKHAERYKSPEISSQEPDKGIKSLSATLKNLEHEHDNNNQPVINGNSGNVGRDLLAKDRGSKPLDRDKPSQSDIEKPAPWGGIFEGFGKKLSSFREKTGDLHVHIRELGNQIREIAREKYDGIRAKINGWIDSFERTAQERDEHFKQASTGLERENRSLERTKQRVDKALQPSGRTFERGLKRVKENKTNELDQFKSQINLAQYASKQGYDLLVKESSRNSYVMKNQEGDKIVVATAADGHGIYFSVRDSSDNGSIIDFVQKRQGLNLGQVRKELRPELGISTPIAISKIKSKPRVVDRNIEGVIKSVMTMTSAENHKYLTGERKISARVLKDDRFKNVVKSDRNGNAVFLHYDNNGLSGYELKNTGFTGFSRGGKKALWHSSNLENAKEIVIVESGIDALSHASMNPRRDTAYISGGGSLSNEQKALLDNAFKRAEKNGQKITLALDNDRAGKELTRELKTLAPKAEIEISKSKDWNQDLQEKSRQPNRDIGYSR